MPFEKGQVKPAGSGRKKGSKNKKTILRISEYIREGGLNIAHELYQSALLIDEPYQRVKALLAIYAFIEGPIKPREVGDRDMEPSDSEQIDILALVKELG